MLDEATSALNTKIEPQVMKSIESLTKRKTIIISAHRISIVRHCDKIYPLERGRVADEGSHDELFARSPAFAALAT
jgi:subfamily B ATP-binding cassette protein MsbA